ncbi:MAG TPA: hypothetical protein VFD04_09895 [Actinomycetes bacterium]|jgi:hypothetical protein|nr:hypothetical protein [Actinomycetes bacterium]
MRPRYALAAALLVAAAVAGCARGQAEQPPAAVAAPTSAAPAATPVTSATSPASRPAPRDPVCAGASSWGTGPKQVDALPITPEIYNVRAAAHGACDRLVFDVNGLGRVGYLARYVPVVHADPSDQLVHVAGGAALQVTIQAPDWSQSGHQPWRTPWQVGQRLAGGGSSLREVRFAGSFEHVTTFAVGVRSQRPFRVLVLPDPANHVTRIAVDVAR